MKLKNYLFSALCALLVASTFAACSSDDNDPTGGGEVEVSAYKAYILCEGAMNANNASITFYAPNKDVTPNIVSQFYQKKNQKGLGDTAQDIVEEGDMLYITVTNSKRVVKMDKEGTELASLSLADQPRYMVAKDGKLYVTLWSGAVARIDASTMTLEKTLPLGVRLESIAESNGKLYISDIGVWQNEEKSVFVVDIASFTQEKEITVILNPTQLLAVNGEVYVISWGSYEHPELGSNMLQRIKSDGTVESIAPAYQMTANNGVLYVMIPDYATNTTKFYTYNTASHELSDASFLKAQPAEITTNVYAMNVDPYNGDIYIGTTDYTTNGDIYRFKADGTFMEKFDCGGINPKKVLFVK
jgi:hypothetical protein